MQNSKFNVPIDRAPHLKTVFLYQKLIQAFTEKHPSNINVLMHEINIRGQFKIDLLNRRRTDVKKLPTENFLEFYEIIFQYTPSPQTLLFPSLYSSLLLSHALPLTLILIPSLTHGHTKCLQNIHKYHCSFLDFTIVFHYFKKNSITA